MEDTLELQRLNAVKATMSSEWWQLLVKEFQDLIDENEEYIFNPNTPMDERKAYSIIIRNTLKAFIEKPYELIESLKSYEK